jgi:indolepyruvate ferredoxin oxidoreductase beta subunit
VNAPLSVVAPDPRLGGVIKLAVLAVGGQGGGVLTGWIEELARAEGYTVQATSVAGVAQRTGATVYYVEMAPRGEREPVFSLMPCSWGCGRADRRRDDGGGTSHPARVRDARPDHAHRLDPPRSGRVEKMVPGDGIASSQEVVAAAEVAARRLILGDFDALAVRNGSVISASLFGALAGSGALPFPREAFEAAIRAGGKGVEGSLRAFDAGVEAVQAPHAVEAPATIRRLEPAPAGPPRLLRHWEALAERVRQLPAPVAGMAGPGLRKVVEFQDLRYGAEYLGRLDAILARDGEAQGWVLSREAAKHLANAMAYDDVIRVADLKTRGERFARIAGEMGREGGQAPPHHGVHASAGRGGRGDAACSLGCPGRGVGPMDGTDRAAVLAGAQAADGYAWPRRPARQRAPRSSERSRLPT